MRSLLIGLMLISLLPLASGCGTFRSASLGGNKAKSLFGVKKKKDALSQDEALDPLGRRDSNRLLLDDLSPSQLSTTWKARMNGRDQAAAERNYEEAQSLYNRAISMLDANPSGEDHQEVFVDAANKFRLAAAAWPDSTIEEDATYFEGESYFFADRYVQSNRAFEKLVASYSGTRHLDLAEQRRYAIAVYWLQVAENSKAPSFTDPKRPRTNLAGEARRVLHRIRIDDPTGKLADDATLALGKAFMQAKRHYEAADTFEDLRRNYPGSKHQFDAHMLELECRLNGYQGKSYDDTPLRKADDLMKQIVRQFPKQSEAQIGYLEKQATLIQNQIAERDYSMGQYFENRGENLAAKIYYEKVAKQFSNTKLAESVEQQIAEVSQKPPRPDQHAKWLVDLFPNPEAEKPMIIAGDNETIFR